MAGRMISRWRVGRLGANSGLCLGGRGAVGHNGRRRGGHPMADGINRREILMLSAAALAAGAAAAPIAVADEAGAPGAKRRPLKKAYFGLPKGGTLIERFKILKDVGFDGLQLNMPANALPVDKVQEALNESGLQLEGTCDSEHWT